MKVILSELPLEASNIKTVKSLKEIDSESTELIVSGLTEENLSYLNSDIEVFLPVAASINLENNFSNLHVYSELALFPFYKKIRKLIQQDENPRGILRYRRTRREKDTALIASDVYTVFQLLGSPEEIRYTKNAVQNFEHHIVTINFGNGTMAHVEFTFAEDDQVELEWSGSEKKIIEFNSEDAIPPTVMNSANPVLCYSAKDILTESFTADGSFIKEIKDVISLIEEAEK